MAVFGGTIRSQALRLDTRLNVILPWDRPCDAQQNPCRVLYLLHGLSDNADAWLRYTSIERYARRYGLAVVMPEVQRGFYHDTYHDLHYFTYVADELPQLCAQLFGLSRERAQSYVMGLSMGGYGAMKCGLTYPGRYAGCASFSGVLDIKQTLSGPREEMSELELQGLLGPDRAIRDKDDLLVLAEQAAKSPQKPEIFITCGTEDYLYSANTAFRARLDEVGFPYTYREWPGTHEWGFWDQSIQMALEHFFA